uniref:ZnF_CHCC domain-containing protein n=1 Tax=Parastrongyloides trichosuri TaxID=131310 RepID=A0A0N5A6V7_PARTI
MDLKKNGISCEQAREYSIIDYLEKQGYSPLKIRGNNYWFCSPFREERTPSFKVDANRNRYYDFGEGKGGNFIDLAMRLENCTVGELLENLGGGKSLQNQHSTTHHFPAIKREKEIKIQFVSDAVISAKALLFYLETRKIASGLIQQYLRQVDFLLNDKKYYAIGFKNNSGGWELRNSFYKGSIAPKDNTTFIHGADRIAVLEGFMDFLSFIELNPDGYLDSDYMILNGISMFEKARPILESYNEINLYFDNDKIGRKLTAEACASSDKYRDRSDAYKDYKDLNNCICNIPIMQPTITIQQL